MKQECFMCKRNGMKLVKGSTNLYSAKSWNAEEDEPILGNMAADCRIMTVLREKTLSERLSNKYDKKAGNSCQNQVTIERTKCGSRIRRKGGNSILLWLATCLLLASPACSLILDCDSVKNCICSKDEEGGWRIECPNDDYLRAQFPVELKVQRLDPANYYESSLMVQCNTNSPWSYIKGMDLRAEQIHSKIVRLEMKYCPVVDDGWADLLRKLNLTGHDIARFTFVTEERTKSIEIPANFFENMPNIEFLNLRNNKLTSIPDLSSLKNLQSINLRNNDLTSVPANVLSKNPQLNSIALSNNKISEVSPEAFPPALEHLELNNNAISFLNSSSFSYLKGLKRLYLNSNNLDNLDSNTFDGMPSLEVLLLFNSLMTQFPNFKNLDKLANLSISTKIQFTILPGRNIISSGDDATTTMAPSYLPENTLLLKNLPSLENVILRLNHFNSIPHFENLPKLVSIDLQRNEITEIGESAFEGLPSLKTLNLARNKIKSVGIIKASSLQELDVSQNMLTELSNNTFIYLNSLKRLNLSKNQIIDVTQKTFEPLSYLEELDLSFNQVTFSSSPYSHVNIRDEIFGDWSNRSPLKSSLNLRKLYLSHNKIPKLGFSDWTQLFTQINEIDLSYNDITKISANDLNFITSNLTVNLENNKISTVDMRLSMLLLADNASPSKETRVYLGGNPLSCDCLAFGLKTFSLESYDIRIKNLECMTPPELKGTKLVEVSNDKLLCNLEKKDCPEPCSCKERTVDRTILIDCSEKNLTLEEIPKLDVLSRERGPYRKWMIELDLSGNEIVDFNNNAYIKQYLNKTKHINLSGNKLSSSLFLERIGDYQPTTFAISDNPFPCENCVGFQIPWRAYPTRISDLANVTCQKAVESSSNGDSNKLVYVQENSKEFENLCAKPKIPPEVVLPLVIAVILLSCLCIGLFLIIRYGWAIKAYLYSKGLHWCLFWEKDLDLEEEDKEKLYDAFVSYSHRDEEWVVEELASRLEDNEGFKLCLHFRDWTPGDWIPDQIVRSVDKSRRTIVILSKNFVESVWSRLEFKAAHAQALKERSNRVILILLGEDLKEAEVQDEELKLYMKMNTFMKWNDPLFWHRLKYALPHKKSSSQQVTEEERTQNQINQMQQREKAIQLDIMRAKLEQKQNV